MKLVNLMSYIRSEMKLAALEGNLDRYRGLKDVLTRTDSEILEMIAGDYYKWLLKQKEVL